MSGVLQTSVSFVNAERIAAFIHIADGTDLMLSSPAAMQHKLFAVRCIRGHKTAELLQNVETYRQLAQSLSGSDRETYFRELALKAQVAYAEHLMDVASVSLWLKREDPVLFEAAKVAAPKTSTCSCGEHDTKEHYDASLREWIDSIALPKPTNAAQRLTKKRRAAVAMPETSL